MSRAVRCQTYENKHGLVHALGFWDFSRAREGDSVVVFESMGKKYCLGLGLTPQEAETIAATVQKALERVIPERR